MKASASAVEIPRAFVQASLIERKALEAAHDASDVMMGHHLVKQAFITDVSPVLAEARRRKGGAIDSISVYRASGYQTKKTAERPPTKRTPPASSEQRTTSRCEPRPS